MIRTPEIPLLPWLIPHPRVLVGRREARMTAPQPLVSIDRRFGRQDRRAAPRLEVELDCEERSGDRCYVRTTSDLSLFGLSVREGKQHPIGARVELALFLPDQPKPVEVCAEVLCSCDQGRGLRLAFRRPSLEAVRRIHRFIQSVR